MTTDHLSREFEIAREVQARLLPQNVPQVEGLELAAACIQARAVGGDYYDFLDLGAHQLGFVLADVSGKGIHAALRMAILQAHLRSQVINAPQDPLRVLKLVNRMLCESTDTGQFATLFLGIYSGPTRRLRYINCGHNPPLCFRAGGAVERLEATATVIGSFRDWECALGHVTLAPGDVFVAYSDGLTEAMRDGEPFGEARVVEVVRELAGQPAARIMSELVRRVQEYCGGASTDDLTLLVAKAQ
ncbi:MAG TPA: PP2C family protein-serine/threonine phosphatase [Candidatus Sulfotelmatobacter sp.]|nr:PP2C family protein-serine/threonine phosphatase [Candidatus Sulfotelmatobacter sp.]